MANRLVSKDVSDNIIASSVMALSAMKNMSTKLVSYKDANNVTVGFTGCLIPIKMGDYWGVIDTATDVHRVNDLDTGAIAPTTAYYVYAVTNGTVVSFKTSISDSAPTGYSTSTSELLGGFTTDGSSNVSATSAWDVKTKITNLTLVTPTLGTPASGTVTNLTGTASININGTVGATTPSTGAFTTIKQTTGAADGAMPISDASGNLSLTASTGTGAPVRATSPTLVTPALGTPASGDLQNCTASTTGAKGVAELATNAEALAGSDTSRIITPDDLKYVLDIRIQQFYGVSWDESADTYVRTGATAGQACGVTLADAFLPIQRRMRRCILNDDGTVNYYLSATDSTKKEDGVTAAVLDGTDGQVMIEIPKFWYRYGYSGTTHTWEISPVPLAGFEIHPAFMSDTTELDYVYVSAYEASLYDVSASLYVGQCHQTSVSAVFATSDDSITIATRTGWANALKVGQKLVVSGTANNNGTVTVKAIESATKITVDENLTDETGATTVIQTVTDTTATTGDKLASVSGVCPISGGSANGTRAHFRVWAANRGAGWSQMIIDVHSAIQLLYLTEYASFYSQSVLGYGIAAVANWAAYNDYNPIAKTGNSNVVGNATGNTATSAITTGAGAQSVYLSYRGLENFYGHIWKWVDGFKINNNIPYFCNDITKFDDDEDTTDYTRPKDANGADITMHNANGYQGTLELNGRAFMPASLTGGSASAKITDYYYQNTGWRVAISGGNTNVGVYTGCFCLSCNNASSTVAQSISGRLVFRK